MSGFMTNLIKNYLKAQKIKCVIQKMSKMYLLTCLNNNLRCMYPNLVSGVSSLSVIICNHCPICCVYGETGCYLCEVVKVMLSCGETAINTDAFWLSSLHEACVWNVFFLKEMLKSSWMPCYFTTVTCYLAGYLKPLL